MTDYRIEYGGNEYELPKYSFLISEKLEKQEEINKGVSNFKSKCKQMYNLIADILGADVTKEIIGEFSSTDPNEINILYLKIVKAYSKPIEDFNEDTISNSLDNLTVDKIIELTKAVEKANSLNIRKWCFDRFEI